MKEKKEKIEKPHICIDCHKETNDFYKGATNRGDVCKCVDCYELWIIRSSRFNLTSPKSGSSDIPRSTSPSKSIWGDNDLGY